MFYILFCAALFFPFHARCSVINVFSLPTFEYDALEDLYNSTDGQSWHWHPDNGIPWNFSNIQFSNPCSDQYPWQGIQCSSSCGLDPCNVVSIDLKEHNLDGKIPATIANLKYLELLDLSVNTLLNFIPNELGNLTNLQSLNLGDNLLDGTIPSSFSRLRKLQNLTLNKCFLEGNIPEDLGNLTNLTILNLSGNNLTGSIPSELENLQKLVSLDLSRNRLNSTIPHELGKLTNLKNLVVNLNFLFGTLPRSLSHLSNLKTLILYQNRLTGSIPSEFGSLSHLIVLDLSKNNFVSTIPSTLEKLTRLQVLFLNYNSLTGDFPQGLFNLIDLKILLLNSNRLNGSIPSNIYELSQLEVLNLGKNFLRSSIPSQFGEMTKLQSLSLYQNLLTGTLPKRLSKLTNMTSLLLFHNRLNGSIPSEFGDIDSLEELDLSHNNLTSTIPVELSKLSNLRALSLYKNFFTGTLPQKFSLLTSLNTLLLYENNLNGSIPSGWGDLSSLLELDLNNNQLTSTIPIELTKLPKLKVLMLYSNMLTGTIYSEICKLQDLLILTLSFNYLSGSIPKEICQLRNLYQLELIQNHFTSTIPSCLNNMTKLSILFLDNNFLNGSITSSLYNSPGLHVIYLNNNLLSSTISPGICNTTFQIFDVSSNELTGRIPDCFTKTSSRLTIFNVSYNALTGTLPRSFSNVRTFSFIGFAHNYFVGTVENLFRNATHLNAIDLSHNQFTGPIDGLVDAAQANLSFLAIAENQLTGFLPSTVLESLETFIADINCFEGSIPESYCQLHHLKTLILDGLKTASSCKQYIIKSAGTYSTKTAITGSIPACLFNLPKLQTLHLSGNRLKGTLPSNLNVSKVLTALSLSNNLLKGTIPFSILLKPWQSLDLSFNYFDGTLPEEMPSYGSESSLLLEVNRLSGGIPSSLLDAPSISILSGNMFSCSSDRSSLPVNDPSQESYQCGSNYVDMSLYAYGGTLVVLIAFSLLLVMMSPYITYARDRYSELLQAKKDWLRFFVPVEESNKDDSATLSGDVGMNLIAFAGLRDLYDQFIFMSRLILTVVTVIVIVGVPLYTVLTIKYGTYAKQYVWMVSAVYLSGFVPTVSIGVFLLLVLLLYFLCCRSSILSADGKRTFSSYMQSETETEAKSRSSAVTTASVAETALAVLTIPWRALLIYLTVVVINAVIVLAVNGAYIYALANNISFEEMIFIAFFVSVFKIVWSIVVINDYFLFRWKRISEFFDSTQSASHRNSRRAGAGAGATVIAKFPISFSAAMIIFNNILAPYLAEALVSADCFYYALLPYVPDVNSSFSYFDCSFGQRPLGSAHLIACYRYQATGTSNFSPPYNYSYQCSSALITSFAYVFIIRYFLSSIVFPLVLLVLKVSQQWAASVYGTDSALFLRLTALLPIVLKPLAENNPSELIDEIMNPVNVYGNQSSNHENEKSYKQSSLRSNGLSFNRDRDSQISSYDKDKSGHSILGSNGLSFIRNSNVSRKSQNTRLSSQLLSLYIEESGHVKEQQLELRKKGFIAILVGDLAVLMTYGALFPPLAVVVGLSIISDIYLRLILLGRLIHLAMTTQTQLEPLIEPINREMLRIGKNLRAALPGLSGLFVLFYSFTLFDTLGDAEGGKAAFRVFPIMFVSPLLFWMVLEAFNRIYKFLSEKRSNISMDSTTRLSVLELRESLPGRKSEDIR